jgi:hypothetical protein
MRLQLMIDVTVPTAQVTTLAELIADQPVVHVQLPAWPVHTMAGRLMGAKETHGPDGGVRE